MKRLNLFFLLLIAGGLTLSAQTASPTTLFEQGNACYQAQQYDQAATLYEQCLTPMSELVLDRHDRAQVYYNLGNARYKQGHLSQAILAYERCLRLQPRHKDARYNLALAQSRITDNLTDNSSFFVAQWATTVRNLLTEQAWTYWSIGLFVLALAGVLLFAFSGQVWLRKTAFHTAWMVLLLSIVTLCNAASINRRDTRRAEAIITQGVLNAKSSPDQSGTELFTLHEGTKVTITETLGEWCNIRVGNNEGWILLTHLERI